MAARRTNDGDSRGGKARREQHAVEVFEYRMGGATFRAIAEKMKLSVSYVFELYRSELDARKAQVAELADEERTRQDARLESIILAHWGSLDDPRSAELVLKALDRKARLWGLDAPVKVEHGGTIEHEDAAERRRRILAETADAVAQMTPEQLAAEAASLLGGDE
jgi:hypothetical protein